MTELDNPKYTVIGAGRHIKAKRQVPGRVNLRLNICLSLSKLINPLQLQPRRAPGFYSLVRTTGSSLPPRSPRAESSPFPVSAISLDVYLPSASTNSSSVRLTSANSFEVFFGNGLPGTALLSACAAEGKGRRATCQRTGRPQRGQAGLRT